MKRPDADMIRRIKKANFVDNDKLKRALDLPYFYMSYKFMNDFKFETSEAPDPKVLLERGNGRALVRNFSSSAEFVYDEFVLTAQNRIHFEHKNHYETVIANYWGCVQKVDDTHGINLFIEYPETREIYTWFGWMIRQDIIEDDGTEVTRIVPEMTEEHENAVRRMLGQLTDVEFDSYVKGISQQAGMYYMFINKLMHYLKYGDKHAVEMVPEKPKPVSPVIARDRPWAAATGPRVLLLDKMPATQTPGTGTHASPKPHRRRGHWKTLSHPRFRHHPKFGEKIYVKPSFVGPRQASYEGNIYRLVQPLEEAFNV